MSAEQDISELKRQIAALQTDLSTVCTSFNQPSSALQTPLSSGYSLSDLTTGARNVFGGREFLGNFAADTTVFEAQAIAESAQCYIIAMGMNSAMQGHAIYMASTPNFAFAGKYNGGAWNQLTSSYFGATDVPSLPLVLVVNDLVPTASAFVAFAAENIGGVKKVGIGGVPSGGIPTGSGSGATVAFFGDTLRLFASQRTPASSAAAGVDGEICYDSGFIYVHGGGSWRRAALSVF